MDRPQMILVVGEEPTRTGRWIEWLERAGHSTLSCPGPTFMPCPRLGGLPCALRQMADAAIVEIQAPGEPHPYGEWRERSCTKLPDDRTTVFVSEDDGETTAELHHPVTPVALLESVDRVLGGESQPLM